MRISFLLILFLSTQTLLAQVYVEKKTRHRFAQMHLGLDMQSNFGGSTRFFDTEGQIQSLDISNSPVPRFLIGGTHFWGHADFYIAIPLAYPSQTEETQDIAAFRGVETVFKYYPLRIENNKLRPYIGISLAPFFYSQDNNNFRYPDGPGLNHTSFPALAGLSFNSKSHFFDLGLAWNYNNKQDYYISRSTIAEVETPPVYATLSYRYLFETTLSAEKDWESGRTEEITNLKAQAGKLNGFFFGAGISSAFWLQESDYNRELRPYIGKYNTSIMPDLTLGYYLHNPDLNFSLGYRSYGSTADVYGANQRAERRSFLLEATKFLFDYHGFVPFIGPVISQERLSFQENFEGTRTLNVVEDKMALGVTFGWDIRPNRITSWTLRTNLRWFPSLDLELDPNSSISFSNLEFNFIQFILYPNRLLVKRR